MADSKERSGRRRFRRNLLLLLAFTGACDLGDCSGPVDLFDVEGVVLINDQPTPGVTVRAGGESATTQADGSFRMTFETGTAVSTVNVDAPTGVHFRMAQIIIAAFDDVWVEFEGYREAAISGRVLAFGQPVPGVQLELDGISFDLTTTSAPDGSYRFDGVPPALITPHTIRALSGPSGFELGIAGTGINISILGRDITLDLQGNFAASPLINGRVTSGGMGLAGVIVTATGPYSAADTTDASGSYAFRGLPAGTYTLAIAGFDASAHRFAMTSQTVTVATDTVVNFAGSPILPNQPPTALIVQPTSGSSFQQGSSISFQGSGTDPEDGALTGQSLAWTSSLDGALGTGAAFTLGSLSVGAHTITLTATDAQGASGSAAVDIVVSAAPPVPGSIAGAVTANGAGIGGVAVTLTGTASASTATGDGGVYSFSNLMPGTYTVTITNPFPGVTFPALSQTVTLASGQNLVVNFAGTYGSTPAR